MSKKITSIYDYKDNLGSLISQTIRYEPKSFSQRRIVNGKYVLGFKAGWYEKRPLTNDLYLIKDAVPDENKRPNNEAIWLAEFKPVLYHLPEIVSAIKERLQIFIVEGEKDADNLSSFGFEATCCPMGAGKWRDSYTQALKGCEEAIVIADKDEPGRKHASYVANKLSEAGIAVKLVEMPDRNGTSIKDISDWLEAGGTKEEFENLCHNAEYWKFGEPSTENSLDTSINGSFAELIDEYGQPYYDNNGTVTSINESFWAGLYFHENIVVWKPDENVFYKYGKNTGSYKKITVDLVKKEISNRIYQVSQEKKLESLEKQRRNSVLNNVVAQLRGIAEKQEAFKKESSFIHVANGMIVFKKNGETDFVDFSPEFYSRNQSPILFDPNANCSRFLNEFLLPAVSKEDAVLIQKYTGLCLLGKNLIQRFLLLEGLAGTGKTTLSLIIQKLIGFDNVTEIRTKQLSERFELYRYLGKTLLVGVDVPGNFLSQKGTNVIKGLVGGDYFDAEQKGGTGCFQIEGSFGLIIVSNSKLQVRLEGDVGAWRRRLLTVPFTSHPPSKKIPNFADYLIEKEGSGILNWSLEGLKLVFEDIEIYGDIKLSKEQEKRVDALLSESDSLRKFLIDKVVKENESELSVNEIIEAYAEYCPTKAWNPKPITVIHRELEGLMLELFSTSKSNSIRREGKSVRGFRRVHILKKDYD